jgi:hypothetical protein
MKKLVVVMTLALVAALFVNCPRKPNHNPDMNPDMPRFLEVTTSVAVGGFATYGFTVRDSDNDMVAVRFIWGDADTSDFGGWFSSRYSEGESESHTWQKPPDTYFVRAQAKDEHDGLSDWTDSLPVLVSAGGNLPPQMPYFGGDIEARKGDAATFFIATTDPESGGVRYAIDWGDGDTWDFEMMSHHPSGQMLTVPRTMPRAGTFVIKAQAEDGNRNTSFWSLGHRIVVVP